MKTNIQPIEDHQVRLTVDVDESLLEGAQHRAARDLSKRMKIPGFRPGKAPYNVILNYLGEAEIRKEAIYTLVDEIYPKALEEAKIEPYGSGTLEEVKDDEGSPLQFLFKVPLKAETEIGDYRALRIPYKPAKITKADIDERLEKMRAEAVIIEPVQRSAQEGDMLHVQIEGVRSAPEEGEEVELIHERSAPVVIEASDADTKEEWPFSGFSRQLIGVMAGEEKKIHYKYPDDSPFESLRGVEADFTIKVEKVSTRTLPTLDDEFAQSVSDAATIKELREKIHHELEDDSLIEYDRKYRDKIIDKLGEMATFKYPPQLVDDELEEALENLKKRLGGYGMSLETYMKMRQTDEESLKADLRKSVVDNIKRSLLLSKVAKMEGIEIKPEEVNQEAKQTIAEITNKMTRDQIRKIDQQRLMLDVVASVMLERVTNNVWELLLQIAKGELAGGEDKADNPEIKKTTKLDKKSTKS